jgi:hypothetical protein
MMERGLRGKVVAITGAAGGRTTLRGRAITGARRSGITP